MIRKKILLVDDERDVLLANQRYLADRGFQVDIVQSPEEAELHVKNTVYDCIVLDVMLEGPGVRERKTGLDLCGRLKQLTAAPIVFYSNLTEDEEQQQGFIHGGDDYIPKQSSPALFLMKLEACMKRSGLPAEEYRLEYPPMVIDLLAREVTIDGRPVAMTTTLFEILALLAGHPGEIYSLADIYKNIWLGDAVAPLQHVQVQISRLRRKLDEACPRHQFVETVWGKGYYFIPSTEQHSREGD